jgi:glycosyltransferase involved in cell wall biosynthesis
MSGISAYIIAYNEAEKIGDAVKSVLWADEVIVADSHSTDGTDRIAESLGARVVQVDFKGFGDLRNQAIAACANEWIFSLDSDERCTPEARDEILSIVAGDPDHDVFFVPRRNFIMGRWIRFSGYYPDYRQPQLFRAGAMRYQLDAVHERYELLTQRKPGYLRQAIWQIPFAGLSEIIQKIDRYTDLGARKLTERGERPGMGRAFGHGLWAFFKQYVLKLGFLDGWAGLVLAFSNLEATFYKYAKHVEAVSGWSLPDLPEMGGRDRSPDSNPR